MVDESRAPQPHEVEYGELPELTRALRALGSSRRSAGTAQHTFFRGLLEARRKAAEARTPSARLRAFDAAELEVAMERSIERLVAQWPDAREPARRAIRAQIEERVREYRAALAHLGTLAREAEHAAESSRLVAWRAWTVQLHQAFQAADRSWIAIQAVVDSLTAKRPR
jgi:hypothetical protein